MEIGVRLMNVAKNEVILQLSAMTVPNFSAVARMIFDLDGTLIDSKRDLIFSVNAMLLEMGREQST